MKRFFSLLIVLFCLIGNSSGDFVDQCSINDQCSTYPSKSLSIYDDEIRIRSRNCFCDSQCEEYGDCCHLSSSFQSTTSYQCVDFLEPTIHSGIIPFHRLSVWMRTECLAIYVGSKFDEQCRNIRNETFDQNPILFLPVTSLNTNVTYRNYFCAFCNNDHLGRIEFWEYKAFCYGDGTENDYLTLNSSAQIDFYIHNLTRNCSLKTILFPHERGSSSPSVYVRPCKNSLPPRCPLGTSEELSRNCSTAKLSYRYRKNSPSIYRNEFCAQCNELNWKETVTCFDPFLRSSVASFNQFRIHPLSILFDPNLLRNSMFNKTFSREIYSTISNCSKSNELYNLLEKKCLPVTNADQQILLSLKCSFPIQTDLQTLDEFYPNNRSLFLSNFSIVLSKDEFVFLNERQFIFCADRLREMEEVSLDSTSFPLYRHILSIVFTSISLGCLILFLVLFFLIPSLQNSPGQCLLFLSISLLIGHLTFCISANLPIRSAGCFAVAIFIHYFYLSSFVWLLMLSIQIHSTFNCSTIRQDSMEKKSYRLIVWNILVCSTTGIVILIACLVQFLRPQSSFSPAYGSMYCSISKPHSMILFFLVPIAILLLLVLILFVKTLWAIHRSRSIAKSAGLNASNQQQQQQRQMIIVYGRLACLMGLQWILLIFALIIGQTWFWIIFELVNSLPGVFICLGFLCSKRLFQTIRHRFNKIELLHRRQSSRSNTTTSTILSPSSLTTTQQRKKFRF